MTVKILYMFALPRDQHSIPVEGEYKAIVDAIQRSKYRDQILTSDYPGVSLKDFQSVIETYKPNVLHFSGHASQVGDLVFQGPKEESQKVPKDPFTNAFKLLGENLKLVVLSACYSKDQAEGVSKHVDRVIGIDEEIDGDKAVMFSEKFYESIGNGKSVEEAFDWAKNQVSLNTKNAESVPTPVLLKNPSRDPSPLFLIETPTRRLNEYLNYIINETSGFVESVHSGYETSYIENRNGILISMLDDWNTNDTNLEEKENDILDAYDIVEQFLASGSDDPYLVIGAPFGVGKSSLTRKITYDLALKLRGQRGEDTNYIPILITDTNTMDNYYYKRPIEEILTILADKNKKILIIFDGVDEYKDGIKEFLKRIRGEPFTRYAQRKIILTTRLDPGFPTEFEAVKKDKYLRLLPFTVPQVNEFFERLHIDLTYQMALEFGIDGEDIRKPLLALILSAVYRDNKQDLLELKEEKALSGPEYRAFIYLNFIHGMLTRGETSKRIVLEDYKEKKKILRRMALLVKLFKGNLTENVIMEESSSSFIDLFELYNKDPTATLREVLRDYFYMPLLDNKRSEERRVLFIHSTFKEYLMAENYIEILLVGNDNKILNSSWMNVTIPTKESTEFLEGLLGLIKRKGKSPIINKWIEFNENGEMSLLNSFNSGDWTIDPITHLIANSLNDVNDDTVALLKCDFKSENSKKTAPYFAKGQIQFNIRGKSKDTSINEYWSLWIRRWISLFVLSKIIDPSEKLPNKLCKEKLTALILLTGQWLGKTHYYLKKLSRVSLSGADLSNADLSNADLYGADLSNADLSNAKLWNANLYTADLSGAKLHAAVLVDALLYGATLSNVDLSDATLSNVDLSDANLAHVNLDNATLSNVDLSDANLAQVNLDRAASVSGVWYKGETYSVDRLKRLSNKIRSDDDDT
jgi:pentapeptide repeat protein/CHAT domain-containing protein